MARAQMNLYMVSPPSLIMAGASRTFHCKDLSSSTLEEMCAATCARARAQAHTQAHTALSLRNCHNTPHFHSAII